MYIITNSRLCCFVIPVVSAITLDLMYQQLRSHYTFCTVNSCPSWFTSFRTFRGISVTWNPVSVSTVTISTELVTVRAIPAWFTHCDKLKNVKHVLMKDQYIQKRYSSITCQCLSVSLPLSIVFPFDFRTTQQHICMNQNNISENTSTV